MSTSRDSIGKGELGISDVCTADDEFFLFDNFDGDAFNFAPIETLRAATKQIDGLDEAGVFTDEAFEFNGRRFFLDSDGVANQDIRLFDKNAHYRDGDLLSRTEAIYGDDITVVVERGIGLAGHFTVSGPEWGQGILGQYFQATIYDENNRDPADPLRTGVVEDRFSFIPLPFFMKRAERLLAKTEKMAGRLALERS